MRTYLGHKMFQNGRAYLSHKQVNSGDARANLGDANKTTIMNDNERSLSGSDLEIGSPNSLD